VTKLDDRKILLGRPRPLPWPKVFVTRMPTQDLFVYYSLKSCFQIFISNDCLTARFKNYPLHLQYHIVRLVILHETKL